MKSRTQLETELFELRQKYNTLSAANNLSIIESKCDYKNQIHQLEVTVDDLHAQLNEVKSQLSKKNKEYNSLLNSYTSVRLELDSVKDSLVIANKQIEVLNKKIEDRDDKINFISSTSNKNSSNSSMPPSTDNSFKRKIHNNKKSSNKTLGGQPGHAPSAPELLPNPTTIVNVSKKNTCKCGGAVIHSDTPEKRQLLVLHISCEVIEYQGVNGVCSKCGKEHLANFPKNVSSKIQYDDSVKVFSTLLSDYANVPLRKIRDLIASFTGIKGPSIGSINNWKSQVYSKIIPVVNKLKKYILSSKIIHSDETPVNVSGKRFHYSIGAFTKNISVINTFRNRHKSSFIEMDILPKYKGICVNDHFSTYYNLGDFDVAECNIHTSRYLKGVNENTVRKAAIDFYNFLYCVKSEVESSPNNCVSDDRYSQIYNEYLTILDRWDDEFEKATADKNLDYFKDERRLKSRLRKFIDNHLLFAKVPEVPFDNNEAERGVRFIKGKLDVIGCFKSLAHANGYANFISIIDTARKNGLNPVEVIKSILSGNTKVFDSILA